MSTLVLVFAGIGAYCVLVALLCLAGAAWASLAERRYARECLVPGCRRHPVAGKAVCMVCLDRDTDWDVDNWDDSTVGLQSFRDAG